MTSLDGDIEIISVLVSTCEEALEEVRYGCVGRSGIVWSNSSIVSEVFPLLVCVVSEPLVIEPFVSGRVQR